MKARFGCFWILVLALAAGCWSHPTYAQEAAGGATELVVTLICTGPPSVVGSADYSIRIRLKDGSFTTITPSTKLECAGARDSRIDPNRRTISETHTLAEGEVVVGWGTALFVTGEGASGNSCVNAGTNLPVHNSCRDGKYGVQFMIQ